MINKHDLNEIGNILRILEMCNLLSICSENKNQVLEMQKQCKELLEQFGSITIEWLKDYFDKETYTTLYNILQKGKNIRIDLEYSRGDGIWFNCIYINAEFEEPLTIIVHESWDKYQPVQRILQGETTFEIVLDPTKVVTSIDDYGMLGSYFEKLNPEENEVEKMIEKLANNAIKNHKCDEDEIWEAILDEDFDKCLKKAVIQRIQRQKETTVREKHEINDAIDRLFNELEETHNIKLKGHLTINNLWEFK